jgi:uncharacterized heparinase superfamily protein
VWSERGDLARDAAGKALRRVRGHAYALSRHFWPFGRPNASRLLFAPHDLRTADPTVAADIYAGYFTFSGRTVSTQGQSPFDVDAPSLAWEEALCGFAWLRHLRAADTAIARSNARALVEDFIAGRRDRGKVAANPAIVARRLMSFLAQSPLLLEGADHSFYDRFLRQLCRMIEQLELALAGPMVGLPRLQALAAIALATLCLEGLENRSEDAGLDLAEELDRQILADGGHVSRNPALLIDLLLDLLPLRETCLARGLEVPRGLVMAVDRIMPHLKLFRHSDGELALFNGMGLTQADVLATLVAYDDARGRAIEHAPYSGYDRIEAGESIVIVDTGAPPPRAHSAQAHAGTLAFELSSNGQRLVVNCGVPRAGTDEMLQAARVTAAHSTLVAGERSSSRFGTVMGTRRVVSGPRDMQVARDGLTLQASHDGYRKALGIDHHRRLELSASGTVLSGEDQIMRLSGEDVDAGAALPCELRFHLHPALKVSLVQDGAGALLLTPSGEAWAFEAPDHLVSIEESVLFASADRMRRREQLVIRFDGAVTMSVIWRFARIGTAPRRTPSTSSMTGDRLV